MVQGEGIEPSMFTGVSVNIGAIYYNTVESASRGFHYAIPAYRYNNLLRNSVDETSHLPLIGITI